MTSVYFVFRLLYPFIVVLRVCVYEGLDFAEKISLLKIFHYIAKLLDSASIFNRGGLLQ